jgi:lysophospholipase L1-like esterase
MKIAFIGDSLTAGRPGIPYFEILRQRLTGHELINLGWGNDSVISLYSRIAALRLDALEARPFDLAFLWVGVNDVVENPKWLIRFVNALIGQPRARDLDEFRAYYRRTLDLLCRRARRVIAVPPVLKGEDLNSPWNQDVKVLANAIKEIATGYEQVDYLDLRSIFVQALTDKPASDYVPGHVPQLAMDVLFRQRKSEFDQESAELGLHLTVDGVHLNSAGATLVAEAFTKAIERYEQSCGTN